MESLCRDRVTVYRLASDRIHRQVFFNASLQTLDKLVEDTHTPEWERPFLLILPGEADIQVGDRVIRGEGPEIDLQAWPEFVQENVDGLCHVQFVQLYRFGLLSHTEAGRKASTFLY